MLKHARVLVLIGALTILAFGLLAGTLGAAVGLLSQGAERLLVITASESFLALTVGLGLALAWHAWRSLHAQASALFRPTFAWLLALLFGLAVVAGHLVQAMDVVPVLLLPPLHIVASVLPPLIIVLVVARRLRADIHWREAMLQLSSGAFLSTSLAIVLESALVVGVLAAIFVLVAMQPGGLDRIQQFLPGLPDGASPEDQQVLVQAAQSPVAVGAVLLLVGVLMPAIEETVKALGVPLMVYRRPTQAQAFFWGLAGGAGFALTENLFNSLLGLDSWSTSVLLRIPASFLHCFTGGLMGLAWFAVIANRAWRRGFGLFVAAVGTHGLWNAVSVGATLLGAGSPAQGNGPASADLANSWLTVVLILLFLGIVVALVLLTRRMRENGLSVESTNQEVAQSMTNGRSN